MNIDNILSVQREYFKTGETLSISFRIKMLKRLYNAIKSCEAEIISALHSDLGKSDFEGFMCEIGLTLSEISYMIKHTPKFAGEHRVRTPLSQFASRSYTQSVPYGNTLIISPWNYPFLLSLEPLVNAVAAGRDIRTYYADINL